MNKRILSFVMALIMIMLLAVTASAQMTGVIDIGKIKACISDKNELVFQGEDNSDGIVLGDTDLNGVVEILDATLIQRILVSLDTTSEKAFCAGNVDVDEDLTVMDATYIQRYVVQLKVEYPIGELIIPSEAPTTQVQKFTVRFIDHDGTVLKTQTVESGSDAVPPTVPTRIGYVFNGWNKPLSNIAQNTDITAQYKKLDKATISVGNIVAKAGETVVVPVVIHNNPGINGMQLNISYNDDIVLEKAQNGSALSSLNLTLPGTYENPSKFLFDGMSENEKGNGIALVLTFSVPSDAVSGVTYGISVSYPTGTIYDTDLNDVDFDVINGAITVY